MEQLIEDLAHSLGSWAYVLVAVMAIAETAAFVGFIAPGEFTIILGGVLAGEGTLSIGLLIGIVWASIVIGDSIGFMLGRRLGREFVRRHGHRVRLTEERIERVEGYFARHGGKTIFLGRWVGFVRPLMPFTAGASGMAYRRFLPYDVLSAGLFGATFSLLGYIFWHSFDTLTQAIGRGAIAFGVLVAVAIGSVLAFKRLRDPEERRRWAATLERLAGRPAARPFAIVLGAAWRYALRPVWRWVIAPIVRWLGPPLRFLVKRLTPGELGIELTSLLAIAAVCGYLFGIYTDLVTSEDRYVSPADDAAYDLSHDIETGFLTSLIKLVSGLGAWEIATAGVLIAIIVLLRLKPRRIMEAAVLAAGYGIMKIAVPVAKDLVERPRPPDPLTDAQGWSFPSGHAATAVVYLVLAVILARALPSATWRVGAVVASIVVAAAIGLSRVYLRTHYLSDVIAGWSLALAIFALCACLALVVSYLRNNGRSTRPLQAEPLGDG